MAVPMRFEVLADCPECQVESALLEVYDEAAPACRLGVPAAATCRLCDARFEGRPVPGDSALSPSGCPSCGVALPDDLDRQHTCPACGLRAEGVLVGPPVEIADRSVLEARLRAWALAEGSATPEEFLESSFLGIGFDELHRRLRAGERVETSFDVFFHLFGHATMSGPVRGETPRRRDEPEAARSSRPSERTPSRPPVTPRAFLYSIVSVMAADGEIKEAERAFVDRILESEGHAPLRPEEIRVHRPAEIARAVPTARRHEAVELMVQLAAVDGETDASEIRVAKAFAAAWGVPSALVNGWIERYKSRHATGVRRFLRRLRSFFFVDVEARAAVATGGGR